MSDVRVLKVSQRGHGKNYKQALWLVETAMKLLRLYGKGHIIIEVQESDAMTRLRKYEAIEEPKLKFVIDEFLGENYEHD